MFNVQLYSPPSVPEAHFLHPRINAPHFSVWKGEVNNRFVNKGWNDALNTYRNKVTKTEGPSDDLRRKLTNLSNKMSEVRKEIKQASEGLRRVSS